MGEGDRRVQGSEGSERAIVGVEGVEGRTTGSEGVRGREKEEDMGDRERERRVRGRETRRKRGYKGEGGWGEKERVERRTKWEE